MYNLRFIPGGECCVRADKSAFVVISAIASKIHQSANQKSFRVRIEMVRVGFKALFVTMS